MVACGLHEAKQSSTTAPAIGAPAAGASSKAWPVTAPRATAPWKLTEASPTQPAASEASEASTAKAADAAGAGRGMRPFSRERPGAGSPVLDLALRP